MNPIIRPVIVELIFVAALAFGSYLAGRADGKALVHAEQAAIQAKVIEQHNDKAEAAHVVETKAVRRQTRTAQTFARINLGVTNHALTDAAHRDCLDADGLRLWSAANAGAIADPLSTGQPDGSLPTTAATSDGQGAGGTGEPRRDGAAVSPVPQPAAGSCGLAAGDGGDRP